MFAAQAGTRYSFHRMARYLSRETEPYGKWKGIPIYLTTILTAVFVVGMIATAVLRAADSQFIESLILHVPLQSAWGVLGIVTYPFMGLPDFFTPFAIMCFYWWACGIETHLGRRPLVTLLAILALAPAAAAWFWWGLFGMGSSMQGNYLLTIGLLIAFATLYPNTEVWGWIPFKYFAAMCVACGLLIKIGDKAWGAVAHIVAICLISFLYIRHAVDQEYDDHVPISARIRSWFRRKPRLRVLPASEHTTYRERRAQRETPVSDTAERISAEVDALLEKIARNGISSLTDKERAKLELARMELLKKERK